MDERINVVAEDYQRALGLCTAHLEQPGPGILRREYVNHLRGELDEIGPIRLTQGLVTIVTALIFSLANETEKAPQEVLRSLAIALATQDDGPSA